MPKTSTLIPLVLTLVLGSPAAVHAQQQWNASAGDFPEASLPTLPLSRIGIPGVDVTMQDALRSDQERASWLYESAMYRETTPSPEQNVTGVLSSRAAPPSAPLSNAVSVYIAAVSIGSPPTTYNLIVDTGSANAWIRNPTARGVRYRPTKSSHSTDNRVRMNYVYGSFRGDEYLDDVRLGSVVAYQQSIGVAYECHGFDSYDGVLGIGPSELNQNSVDHRNSPTATVVETMYMQRSIEDLTYGIWFSPVRRGSTSPGELSFGRPNSQRYEGQLRFASKTHQHLANQYWAVDAWLLYGGRYITSSLTATVLDSGTSLIVLDQVTFRQYKAATGAVEDAHTGMLRIPESRYSWLKTLDVWVQGVGTLSLSPNAQIWPRSYNKAAGGQPGYIYLVVANSKRNDGVVLGMVFLERFYTYYDSRQHRVGFANTQHTFAEVN